MRLAHLAVLPALLIATAASAADTIPLAALITNGLVEGAKVMVSGFGNGTAALKEPGYYEVTFDKAVMKFLFDEPDTCNVTLHAEIPGQGTVEIRYDFTAVTGIKIEGKGQFDGLNAVLATIEGPGVVQVLMNDKWVTQPGFAFLGTSLTAADLQTAADELQRIC
ncbi:MAG: hypothetical protein ABIQ30_11340 [Devosia sp.]